MPSPASDPWCGIGAGPSGLAALRHLLAAGLAATGRLQVDLVLKDGGLLMLEPEFIGSAATWESLVSPTSRVLVPASATIRPGGPKVEKVADPETLAKAADLVLRF